MLDLGGKTPTSKRLSVGYRPARVFMDDDGRSAYVVTDAGIDVIDLGREERRDRRQRDRAEREPGERHGTSRREHDRRRPVRVREPRRQRLRDGRRRRAARRFKDVTLPGVVTDLGSERRRHRRRSRSFATESFPRRRPRQARGQVGRRGQAGAGSEGGGADVENGGGEGSTPAPQGLVGGQGGTGGQPNPGPQAAVGSMAVLLPVATIFNPPHDFVAVALDEVFGSVELGANDGQTALLYSNGVPSTHLTLLGLGAMRSAAKHRTVDLKLPVFSAVSSPDGAHAIVLLKPPAGSKQARRVRGRARRQGPAREDSGHAGARRCRST